MLLGAKKARKKVGELTGGVVGYGSAAAPGASVYRAYRNWQTGKRVGAGGGSPVSAPVQPPRGFEVPARNGASA
jgi:uncharacterized membrane protein YebE (DUF533 family)